MSKMLDKVSKLLAQAENAGTPEEAETFMAKAMELSSANAIDLAVARLHQAKKERVQEPEERTIRCNDRKRRHNRKHFIDLCLAICEVNDCETLIDGRDYSVFAVGFPSDLDVVEALYAHLSVQMTSECDEALKRGDHKETRKVRKTKKLPIEWEDREWGQWNGKQYYDDNPDDDVWKAEGEEGYEEERDRKRAEYEEAVKSGERTYSSMARGSNYEGGYRKPVPPPSYREVLVPLDELEEGEDPFEVKVVSAVDGRVFRQSFYESFVMRMRRRLWESKRQAQKDRGVDVETTNETALALRDKKEEIKKADEERRAKVHHIGTYHSAIESETRKYDHTGTGSKAGIESAERVPIDSGREVKK